MKLTQADRDRATQIARRAQAADNRGDTVARNKAAEELWVAVGYWLQPRTLTTAEYRGERLPPRMIRMPAGRSLPWVTRKWDAVAAWAAV
jgi:hypothetical protein